MEARVVDNMKTVRGVIRELETTTVSDLRPVTAAVEILERKFYAGDYTGPDGLKAEIRDLQPLADTLLLCLGRLGYRDDYLSRVSWLANHEYWNAGPNGSGQKLPPIDPGGWESTRAIVKKVLSLVRGWVRQMNPTGRPALESITSDRVSLDAATRAVTLDGEVFNDVPEAGFACLQAVTRAYLKGDSLPVVLSKLPGLEGKHIDRELKRLPQKLRDLIHGQQGAGSWLSLPPKPV
jgi:hypothetical protein